MLGAVERTGQVVAKVVTDLSGSTIMKFVTSFIRGGSRLITDEYKGYSGVKKVMEHNVVQHSKYQYVDADDPSIHTNTIEGFWSLLKRAWYGTHHHYSKKHAPLYVAEACYQYNHRKTKNIWEVVLKQCFA